MNGTVRVAHDLDAGVQEVSGSIVRIGELVRYEDAGVFLGHLAGLADAFVNTLADISLVVDEDQLCAVLRDQLAALAADGIRHDDDHLIALDRTDEGEADALVAAGRFHDYGAFGQEALPLGGLDHVESGSCLNGSADIDTLELDQNFRIVRTGHAVETDQGGVADGFQYIFKIHNGYLTGTAVDLLKNANSIRNILQEF